MSDYVRLTNLEMLDISDRAVGRTLQLSCGFGLGAIEPNIPDFDRHVPS